MMNDPRASAAAYYDLAPHSADDIPFYIAHLPGADASVLELGCGTGRVTLPLSMHCGFLHGLDSSEGMIRRCEAKLAAAQIPKSKVTVQLADVTEHSLGRRFDRVIAPFRMLQNLATDNAVDGFFQRIGRAPQGRWRCSDQYLQSESNAGRDGRALDRACGRVSVGRLPTAPIRSGASYGGPISRRSRSCSTRTSSTGGFGLGGSRTRSCTVCQCAATIRRSWFI